ncbi:MAG: ABC transporter permease [Thermosulfidibacteraceae bacterium]|jgi:putative ABC transport system permease protein
MVNLSNRYYSIFKEALSEILNSRIYFFFMVISLFVGIASMVTVYSLGKGFEIQVIKQLESFNFGSNAFLILAGGGKFFGPSTTRSDTLVLGDVEVLKRLYFVKKLDYFQRAFMEVSNGKDVRTTMVFGVTLNYPDVNNWHVSRGRFFSKADIDSKAKVCVVGTAIEDELYGGNALGKVIKINGIYFTIIGVLERKGAIGSFRLDDRVLIPITTANTRVFNRNKAYLDGVKIIFDDRIVDFDVIKSLVTKILRERHKLQEGEPDDFRIITPDQIVAFRTAVSRVITGFLLVISLVTIVVGGVVVVNIMYANIEDKMKVIAIRMAVGASSKDIFLHYLFIVIVVALISGITGILGGFILSALISRFASLYFYVPINFSILVLVGLLLVSFFFGVFPARKASSIPPGVLIR